MIDLTRTKLFSGKLIFTVVTAFVFAYSVHTKILNAEQVHAIIMLVVAAYFGKPEEKKEL
jgi:hypothetical protein